jgi:hypothetical protein
MAADNGSDRFKTGERVVAAEPMPGIPEGTKGRVNMVEGLTWIRYWVRFENGVVRGSLHREKLARATDWKAIQAERAERARVAALPKDEQNVDEAAGAGEAVEAPGDGGAGSPAPSGALASKVPAHLLERSRQARSKAKSAG